MSHSCHESKFPPLPCAILAEAVRPVPRGSAALLAASIPIFAEFGLKGASARMLASAAGVNIAAISYHFGGKEGLYHAAVRHVTAEIAGRFAPLQQGVKNMLEGEGVPAPVAFNALQKMMHGLATLLMEGEHVHDWGRIVLREQIDPTPAFTIIYEGHIKAMQQVLCRLVAACTGEGSESPEVQVRVHLFIGQVLGMFAAREAFLRLLGVTALEPAHKELVYTMLWAHTRAALGARVSCSTEVGE